MHVLETMIGSILIGGPFSRSAGTITFHKREILTLTLWSQSRPKADETGPEEAP